MARRSGLGRGLDALIPGDDYQAEPGAQAQAGGLAQPGLQEILIDRISPNPRQPRQDFDPDQLAELASSIREHGVLQPLIITYESGQEGHYSLIAGHRRLLAAQQAGLSTVPAVVREVSEQQRLELALVENVQRTDLNPLEQADAFHQLVEEFGLSHEEVAARVGKSRSAVTNKMRLLSLSSEARKSLSDGKISEGHARAILALPTSQVQNSALNTILRNQLSVRQTEELVRRLSTAGAEILARSAPPPEILDLEERLRNKLGTKVRLNKRKNDGTLTIYFYSNEELETLLAEILGADY